MGVVRLNEFLLKNIKQFLLACLQHKGGLPEITLLFVVNSFHKVAKIYSLLEFFRNGGPSPLSPPPSSVPLCRGTTEDGRWGRGIS
jgi:hypothetical protein